MVKKKNSHTKKQKHPADDLAVADASLCVSLRRWESLKWSEGFL